MDKLTKLLNKSLTLRKESEEVQKQLGAAVEDFLHAKNLDRSLYELVLYHDNSVGVLFKKRPGNFLCGTIRISDPSKNTEKILARRIQHIYGDKFPEIER